MPQVKTFVEVPLTTSMPSLGQCSSNDPATTYVQGVPQDWQLTANTEVVNSEYMFHPDLAELA